MAIYQLNRNKTITLIYCDRWCLLKLIAAQNVTVELIPPAQGLRSLAGMRWLTSPTTFLYWNFCYPWFTQPAGRTFGLLEAQTHHLHTENSSVLFSLAETIKAALVGASSSQRQRQRQTLKSFGKTGYKAPPWWSKTWLSHLFFLLPLKVRHKGVLLRSSGLRIRPCHCSGLGCCCGTGSVSSPGTSMCQRHGQKKKKKGRRES